MSDNKEKKDPKEGKDIFDEDEFEHFEKHIKEDDDKDKK